MGYQKPCGRLLPYHRHGQARRNSRCDLCLRRVAGRLVRLPDLQGVHPRPGCVCHASPPARGYRCNLRTSSALLTVGRTGGSRRSTRSVRYSAARTASVSGTPAMVASQALACTASSTRTPGTTCGSQYGRAQTCRSTQPEYRAATSRTTALNWSQCVIASLAGSVGYLGVSEHAPCRGRPGAPRGMAGATRRLALVSQSSSCKRLALREGVDQAEPAPISAP